MKLAKDASPITEQCISPHVEAFLSRAREGRPLAGLAAADRAFDSWKQGSRTLPQLVSVDTKASVGPCTFDVAVAGGTLGIFYATALVRLGFRVAVVERGALQGRNQEWNVSRPELDALVRTGVLSHAELDAAIVREFPVPSRIGFAGARGPRALEVSGVLNLGVEPSRLVADARARFEALGGTVLEFHALEGARVCADGVALTLRPQQQRAGALGAGGGGLPGGTAREAPPVKLSTRLLVDAMGSFSPVAAQARGTERPDGVCVTVGACVRGPFDPADPSDLLFAFVPVGQTGPQQFWEAFPAGRTGNSRTTYMFSYGPCDESRTTLAAALEDYVRLAPAYLGAKLDAVEVERVLFGFFPCFRDSPSKLAFDRILPVGDAAGFQSPVSFGGFASCLRHLERVTGAVQQALSVGDDALLQRTELQRMQFYNPSLSVAWLFNSAMAADAARISSFGFLDKFVVNDLLWTNMDTMRRLGPKVQRPFLQDVVRAGGLTQTLVAMVLSDPVLAAKTFVLVGPAELAEWTRHYLALVAFSLLAPIALGVQSSPMALLAGEVERFRFDRLIDMLVFGSGLDFHDEGEAEASCSAK